MSARFWLSETTSLCRLATSRSQNLAFYRPADDSAELAYLREPASRAGRLSAGPPTHGRSSPCARARKLRAISPFAPRARTMSTTVAVVRLIGNLLKNKALGPRIVPIVADEARTFGMANLFRQVGIYSSVGQLYEPEDANSMLYYKESQRRAASRRGHYRGRRPVIVGRMPPPPTASTGSRCCRSIFSTRCSASSGSAILFGRPPTSGRVGS